MLLMGGRPVMSSRSTIPYEYTSDFSVTLPHDAYSGAKYLKAKQGRFNEGISISYSKKWILG